MVTAAVPSLSSYALDGDVATLLSGSAGESVESIDTTRTLVRVEGAEEPAPEAVDRAVLAAAAELLGAGERLLADTVAYVKQRRQFGREIGSYQAVKHQLADVRIALDFARPLVLGAALGDVPVSAAKVAAGDAAHLASRVALQLHGAIGYTSELDLGLWILRVRALVAAWGNADHHRAVLGAMLRGA